MTAHSARDKNPFACCCYAAYFTAEQGGEPICLQQGFGRSGFHCAIAIKQQDMTGITQGLVDVMQYHQVKMPPVVDQAQYRTLVSQIEVVCRFIE